MARVINGVLVINATPTEASKIKGVCEVLHEQVVNGVTYLAVAHTVENNRTLRVLGVDLIGCEVLRHQYTYPLLDGDKPPFAAQIETASFLTERPRAFCASQPRTGKTSAVIASADFLMRSGVCKKTLIVAPLAVAQVTWPKEVKALLNERVMVIHGTAEKRRHLLAQEARFYLINPDGLKILKDDIAKMVRTGELGVIVFDESSEYGNTKSQLWQAADYLVNKCHVKYAWTLNGTPGDPAKVYGQAKLLYPRNNAGTLKTWQSRTMCAREQHIPGGKTVAVYSVWPEGTLGHTMAAEACLELLQPCIRFEQDEVYKATPVVTHRTSVKLSPEQHRAYTLLYKEAMVATEDGPSSAASASDKVSKLLQISSGAMISGDKIIEYPMAPKIDKLMEIINGTPNKVLVFASYTAVINRLVRELTAKGVQCNKMDGEVTGKDRVNLVQEFMEQDDIRVIIAHPKTAAWGLELARADTIVYFGAMRSGDVLYQQSLERVSSAKQQADVINIYHLSSSTADERSFAALESKVVAGRGLTVALRDLEEQ